MLNAAAVTTLPAPADRVAVPASVRGLQVALHRAGYEVVNIDLDVIANRAVVELKRVDGRSLHFAVDSLGRATLNRFQVEHYTVKSGRRGDVFRAHRVRDQFLGRSKAKGARAGLRMLCSYVADNPAPNRKGITAKEARNAFRPLMSAPVLAVL